MVEGPLVHHIAETHRVLLLGKAFVATSPSGRFTEGAAAVTGRYVSLIEVHGKNIFYKLEKAVLAKLPNDVVVVRIHFGMTGSFPTFVFPGPQPREKTRLRLHSEEEIIDAHLTASVCVHGDMELYRQTVAKLGPDPLRADADKEIVWRKMQITRKTVGSILMDQSLIAGIGNMYRAEILFVCGLHPDQPASTLSRSAFEELWEQTRRSFRFGSATGFIGTVSPNDVGKRYHEKLRSIVQFYAYRQSICTVCGGAIRKWPSAGRTAYACEVCQPLRKMKEVVHKTPVEDTLMGHLEAIEHQGGLISTEDNLDAEMTDSPGRRTSSSSRTAMKPVTGSRRRVVADKILEHQPLMDISPRGLRNFSSTLVGLNNSRYDLCALGKGSLWESARERAGLPRKYHSQVSQFGQIHERNSWSSWQTFTNQGFQTRRVCYITRHLLGTVKPQTRIGLQAVSTLCLGSSSRVLMLSTRLSNVLPFSHA